MFLRVCCWAVVALLLTDGVGAAQPSASQAMIAEVVRNGSVIVREIEFARGAGTLSVRSEAVLRQVRSMLLEHDEWTFEVQVHTNETGDRDRDQVLSDARARALVEWLTRNGIGASRLVARGYGSSKLSAGSAGGTDGLAQNRVELRKLNEE